MNQRQHKVLWGSLFAATLLVSSLIFFLLVPPLKHVVLFFPTAGFVRLESEIHAIPRDADLRVEIERTIESLMSGPLSLKFKRVAPSGSVVRAVFVNGSTAYIDLESTVQVSDGETPLPVSGRLEIIEKSITQNFPSITNVVLLIQGQEVNTLAYQASRKS